MRPSDDRKLLVGSDAQLENRLSSISESTVDCDDECSDEQSNADSRFSPQTPEPEVNHKCSAIHTLERDMPDFDYSDKVAELRSMILAECEKLPGAFTNEDIEKCRNDQWFVERFLLRHKLDMEAAFEMMVRTMRMRHDSLGGIMRDVDYPREFYQIGGVACCGRDRKGNHMLFIRGKVHKRSPEINEMLKAFLYRSIQRADENANGRGIAIVIDCSGAGLSNADMEILVFFIHLLSNYFPKGLSYLLVHRMPWILKPIWHIAKAILPEEHRRLVKFSDSFTIYEYVDREELPDFMGGTNSHDYRQPPENCTTLKEAAKLWGVELQLAKRIAARFIEFLPPGSDPLGELNLTDPVADNSDCAHDSNEPNSHKNQMEETQET